MEADIITVPRDECPLKILSQMGERTKNAWIFLHHNTVHALQKTANEFIFIDFGEYRLYWNATYESRSVSLEIDYYHGDWAKVLKIDAYNIDFSITPCTPERIIFVKMDE